jgi:outer membrane protein assembly factor BamB
MADDCVITMGPRCHLACWDAATGECHRLIDLAQEYETNVPPWYTGQCPLVDDQKLIVAPCGKALMIAIDYTSGKVVWESANPHGWTISHGSVVPMDFEGRRCYVYGASGGVVGIAADDGAILWECTDWPVQFANCPSPVILPGGRVFLSNGYGTSGGSLMLQIEAANGQILAKTVFELSSREFGCEIHTPILLDDHLYGVRKWGRGQMACLDARGKELWNSGDDSFGQGPYLLADGLLVALQEDGILTLAEASPAEYKRLASHPVIPDANEAWGPMAIAGGRLILRDLSRMFCLDLRRR